MRTVRFTHSVRKHRIGRAHAMHVINTVDPVVTAATDEMDARRSWIGEDDRGVALEITAVVLPDYLLVIHVMPIQYRRKA